MNAKSVTLKLCGCSCTNCTHNINDPVDCLGYFKKKAEIISPVDMMINYQIGILSLDNVEPVISSKQTAAVSVVLKL